MSIFSKASSGASTSVIYITVGALTDVWSGIWYCYLRNNYPSTETAFYWCYGFLLTGLTLVLIGLIIGRIGWIGGDAHQAELHRDESHRAELHHKEVTRAPTQAEMTAAAKAPILRTAGPATVPTVTERG
jgi:hypothetical protein